MGTNRKLRVIFSDLMPKGCFVEGSEEGVQWTKEWASRPTGRGTCDGLGQTQGRTPFSMGPGWWVLNAKSRFGQDSASPVMSYMSCRMSGQHVIFVLSEMNKRR